MVVKQGIVAGKREYRISAVRAMLDASRMRGEPVWVLIPSLEYLPYLAQKGDFFWQPAGISVESRDMEICNVDIAREYRGDARRFAENIISDEAFHSDRDKYWQTMSRHAAEALYLAAAAVWMNGSKDTEKLRDIPNSMTSCLLDVLEDLSESFHTSSREQKKDPSMFPMYPKAAARKIRNVVLSNSPVTASCILSLVSAAVDPLREFVPETPIQSSEILEKVREPFFIISPKADLQAIQLLVKSRDWPVTLVEAEEQHLGLPYIVRPAFWTSRATILKAERISIGRTCSRKVLDAFDRLKQEASIDLLASVPVENPIYLAEGQYLSFDEGEFSLEEAMVPDKGSISVSLEEQISENPLVTMFCQIKQKKEVEPGMWEEPDLLDFLSDLQ